MLAALAPTASAEGDTRQRIPSNEDDTPQRILTDHGWLDACLFVVDGWIRLGCFGQMSIPTGRALVGTVNLCLAASCLVLGGCATVVKPTTSTVNSEFIYEHAPFPSCHASTLAETKTGVVAAWFGGTDEKNPDVGIWFARHDGRVWSAPVEVANGIQADGKSRHPCWNPVLFQRPGGPLLLFYKVGPSPSKWWGMLITSDDGGKTWSAPKRLPEGIHFFDKDGHRREEVRLRWWDQDAMTFRRAALGLEGRESELPDSILPRDFRYRENIPVFFGHYWLNGSPEITAPNAACLDFSVAKKGYLTAYRWSGESELSSKNLVSVAA